MKFFIAFTMVFVALATFAGVVSALGVSPLDEFVEKTEVLSADDEVEEEQLVERSDDSSMYQYESDDVSIEIVGGETDVKVIDEDDETSIDVETVIDPDSGQSVSQKIHVQKSVQGSGTSKTSVSLKSTTSD